MRIDSLCAASAVLVLSAAVAVCDGRDCGDGLVGTWRATSPESVAGYRYQFAPHGTVTVLARAESGEGAELREIASASYVLDQTKEPHVLVVKATQEAGGLAEGTTTIEITGRDAESFTGVKPGGAPVRWVRDDGYRYFIVLAARTGTFHDQSGPSFPMLIKTDGRGKQVDAVGTYSDGGLRRFGAIPADSYNEFMNEPRTDADVMLRLEISAAQYERSLRILETWKRRAEDGALLYSLRSNLDNVVMTKAVVESLNQCGSPIDLYSLNWIYEEDALAEKYPPKDIPFQYFRELRRRNESRHVGDDRFHRVAGIQP